MYSKLQTSKLQTSKLELGVHFFADKTDWKLANADIYVYTTGDPDPQHFFGKSLIEFENQCPNAGSISLKNRTTPMIYKKSKEQEWYRYVMTEAMVTELAQKYSVVFLKLSI